MTAHETQAPASAGALPVMTSAEFRCLRELLGLTTAWLAARLGVAERTVQRWDHGHADIPLGVAETVEALREEADRQLDELIDRITADAPLVAYRTDEDAQADGSGWPASWHRALCGRAADEVPGLRLIYWVP